MKLPDLIRLLLIPLFALASCEKKNEIHTPENVTDIDGNVYKTVTIGTQVWMAENLKTTKFNDGTTIPLVSDVLEWFELETPGHCYYNNNISYKATYGALYNWYTVNTEKICPTGWHVPTEEEWTLLTDFLGGEAIAGDKLKESGTSHWSVTSEGVTNESGFSALPGGNRDHNASFHNLLNAGSWWSSTVQTSGSYSMGIQMGSTFSGANHISYYNEAGLSVRCIWDNL